MLKFLAKLVNSNERELAKLAPLVVAVNAEEGKLKRLKDGDFSEQTQKLQARLVKGETLDDILPVAFALVREASWRVNKERPFDVQILAAVGLHQGKIAEQKTGEGKTLTAAMPLFLNALSGRGAHLVTVNDYLARVGIGWMGPIYNLSGLSCAAIIHDASFIFDPHFTDESAADWRLRHLRPISRKEAYQADITYGINSEFGFDYLRDNMARSKEELVQREFHFAIIDEVDSVLIDEARTPHIISAPDTEPTQKYYEHARVVENLTARLDFVVDEKLRTAHLTEHGIAKVENLLGIKDIYEKDFVTVHHIEAALKARTLYEREKDYIVRDGQVIIVDEFTGRLMPGRRWSEGIHQAVEAKEGVAIQQESKTLATISLQNYFRKYAKLAGMTGTAATEAEEFHKIYGLPVVVVPTHRPMVRMDFADQVYKSQRAKYSAIGRDIEEANRAGRPVLVGTTSIEKNEIISQLLRHKGVVHRVLNAKQHEKEAMIIAQAGEKGAVTVATNMAGRGVDIILGGNAPKYDDGRPKVGTKEWRQWEKDHEEVVGLGGLHVIGTERHEARRIDNQLRGRAGRQGDPGSSRFFLSLDDDIMRLFGGEQVSKLMTFFNIPEDQPLEHGMVTRAIEQAQGKVEQFNFDSRKHLLEYDDVMNKQREIMYGMKRRVLEIETGDKEKSEEAGDNGKDGDGSWLRGEILGKVDKEIAGLVGRYSGLTATNEDLEKLVLEFCTIIPFDEESKKRLKEQFVNNERSELLTKIARDIYGQKEKQIGGKLMRYIEQQETMRVIDGLWMEHLEVMTDLQEAFRGVRRYGEHGDPIVGYKKEAFSLFEKLLASIDYEIVHRIYKIQVATPEQVAQIQKMQQFITNAPAIENIEAGVAQEKKQISSAQSTSNQQPAASNQKKTGRNDPCWCGSGKKYKRCHYPN